MNITMDVIDRQILEFLQEDGSLSVAELADRLGMTAPPCWRRVRRLKDAGILRSQVWTVDPASVGLDIVIYASVKLATHDAAATLAFREQIKLLPEILECYILLGSIDVLLKIVVSDIQYYEEFFYKKLSQLPGVREVNSSVVMSEIKKTTSLPLDRLDPTR
ncbi:MAG: Lrp/AsnC family transcriptional regulator [Pseudomonadota bacterium]|uniref:Lrp/AsnC family transcriptional regulator n=1 Tax=Sphingomonas sp. ERG5 TaxID=1381597 RepID=UPI00054B2A32|nr:Lrp/AsnC family transcriptional regulator [Sphingomonas sp. ERG5]